MSPTAMSTYEIDQDNIKDMVDFAQKLQIAILGVSLGIAILSGVLFLILYKRCCGSRVLFTGRIISDNTGAGIQSTTQQQYYPAPSINVQNQPSPHTENPQDCMQPLMMQEGYPLPPSYKAQSGQ